MDIVLQAERGLKSTGACIVEHARRCHDLI